MSKIYGSPLFLSGSGGANKDLPPLLDNFKAFEGGEFDDGLTRLKDLPSGSKVKLGKWNGTALQWKLARRAGDDQLIFLLEPDSMNVIGKMTYNVNQDDVGYPDPEYYPNNMAKSDIQQWLNATGEAGTWYVQPEETTLKPEYADSKAGFLNQWTNQEINSVLDQEWLSIGMNNSIDQLQTNINYKSKITLLTDEHLYNNDHALDIFQHEQDQTVGEFYFVSDCWRVVFYGNGIGISGASSGIANVMNEPALIRPICAPNPEAVVSDEPDDDGCYTIDYTKRTVGDLQVGDKIKVSVNVDAQSFLGENIVFQVAAHNHPTHPENSATLITEKIIACMAVDAAETSYPNGNPDYSLSNLNQWLNSNAGAGQWWSATHDGDVAPAEPSVDYNPYSQRAGFLNMLDGGFVKSLLETHKQPFESDGPDLTAVDVKMFLPSIKEVGNFGFLGDAIHKLFPLFENGGQTAYLTEAAADPENTNGIDTAGGSDLSWTWLMSDLIVGGDAYYAVRRNHDQNPTAYYYTPSIGTSGIRPACNISNSLPLVSSTPDEEGCYLVDWNKINITIQADKMLESRANELAGAVWVYGDHEPENVNDGTKIQLSREEIITDKEPGPETITLADIPVSDAETETIVKLKESDGILHPYIYLVNGYEGSNGALLLRKDLAGQSAWSSSTSTVNYIGQSLDSFIQSNFVNQLDILVKSALINASIKTNLTNSTVKAFALSVTELNITSGTGNVPTEGSAIPYFNSPQRRIADGYYWTRTHVSGNQNAIHVNTSGNPEQGTTTNPSGVRPAIVLPLTFKLKATANSDGSYDMYEESSSAISDRNIDVNYQVTRTIQWDGTKDFFARQFTYNSKKQYQTMLEGAIATLNDVPEGQPITDLESGSKVKLGVWNDTPLQWKVARDSVDQSLRLVLEPVSVTLLGNMAFDEGEAGNTIGNRVNGNNRYVYSNIHQWLNAVKESGWYVAQHSLDAPPAYASSPGFLSGWNETDLSVLDDATLTTTKTNVDGGGTETFNAGVALISTTELGLQSGTGGTTLDIFNTPGNRITGKNYWTRTPDQSTAYATYRLSPLGALEIDIVRTAFEIRPLCSPKSTTYVSLEPDEDGCYTITGVNE